MKHRYRIFLLGLVLLLLGNFALSLIHPAKAYAASADVIDRSTIKVGDKKFVDSDLDDNFSYEEISSSDGCTDRIDGFNNDTLHPNRTPERATLHVRTPAGAGSSACVDHPQGVAFNNRENFKDGFAWIDTNTIKGVDGKLTFSKKGSGNTFTSTKERDGCYDTLTVNPGNQTATLVARQGGSKDSRAIERDDYDWYPFPRPSDNGDSWKWNEQKDCWESPPVNNVRLSGNPKDGSKGAAATGNTAAQQVANSCESKSGVMSWIMCPITEMLSTALDWVDEQINGLLEVDNDAYTNPGLHEAWGQIRNIAYIILLPIMLIMVIGTAVGVSGIDAYTVKRAMPRLLIAIVFIALSWSIVSFLITVSNVVGRGTMGLISTPFAEAGNVSNLSLNSLFGGSMWQAALLPVATIGIIVVFWLFGGTLLLAAGIGLIVLLMRQVFIIALMLAAPLAILAWIFPGNDKLWKDWWSIFSKLLIMYPLIIGVIAVGRIFAWLIHDGASGNAGISAVLQPFAVLIVFFIPYALIPLTFRFAGGFFTTVTGMINDRSKGIFDRQRKGRAAKLERTSQGRMFKGAGETGVRASLNRRAGQVMHANRAGLNPLLWNARTQAGAVDTQRGLVQAMMEDEGNGFKKDDDLSRAAADSTDAKSLRAILRSKDYKDRYTDANGNFDSNAMEQDVSRVEQMRRKYGNDTFRIGAWRQAMAGGTAYKGADAWEAAGRISHGNAALLADMVGQGKGDAMGAGRVDQGGAGFNDTRKVAKYSVEGFKDVDGEFGEAGREYSAAEFTYKDPDDPNSISMAQQMLSRRVVKAQGAGVMSHSSMKPGAIENLVPEVRRRVEDAVRRGDAAAIDRELAYVANLQDSLSGSSPQLAEQFGDGVLLHTIQASDSSGRPVTVTVGQAIEARRGSEVFKSTRREYQSMSERDAARRTPPPPGAAAGPPTAAPTSAP